MEEPLRCAFCGIEAGHDEAIEGGWTPHFFWDEEDASDDPACPDCSAKHLHQFDGDPIVKPLLGFSDN